jgi:hypothetical protein
MSSRLEGKASDKGTITHLRNLLKEAHRLAREKESALTDCQARYNELLAEVCKYRNIRNQLAAKDIAGLLPDDTSIYIGLLENRLAEQRLKYDRLAAQNAELFAEPNALLKAKTADVNIPTTAMQQEFARHYRKGKEDGLAQGEKLRDDLLGIATRLDEWCDKFPSNRIYSGSAIIQIAAQLDAIGADAKQAIAKTGGRVNDPVSR